jgi:hypothetical protein
MPRKKLLVAVAAAFLVIAGASGASAKVRGGIGAALRGAGSAFGLSHSSGDDEAPDASEVSTDDQGTESNANTPSEESPATDDSQEDGDDQGEDGDDQGGNEDEGGNEVDQEDDAEEQEQESDDQGQDNDDQGQSDDSHDEGGDQDSDGGD